MAAASLYSGRDRYDGFAKMMSAYLESGPLRGAARFCRVGSSEALRMVGFALSSSAPGAIFEPSERASAGLCSEDLLFVWLRDRVLL